MAGSNRRRSRTIDSDHDETSRASTPASTAFGDSKRIRRHLLSPTVESRTISHIPQQQGATVAQNETKKFIPNSTRTIPRHQPGAIVRIKLTNFVTYTSAEFFPGPNLNMVIGPNGTGKSTLVCAICLGLGWSPSLLGRAKDPSEFVKHGCKEAIIEIELQRASTGPQSTGSNPIVVRSIKKDSNKSTFSLNGNAATNKAVLELARGYNIQIDNLCQFLPQDRVVEFAQMSPIQMLESTLQAAAEPATIRMYEQLIELRKHQKELMGNNNGDREVLQNLENRQEMQRTEVERLRERTQVQQKINWLEKCKCVAQYADAKRRVRQTKERNERLGIEVRRLDRESAPTLRKVNEKKEYFDQVIQQRNQKEREVKRAEGECDRLMREVKSHEAIVQDLQINATAERKAILPRQLRMQQLRVDIQTLKTQKENKPEPFDSRAMNLDIQQITARVRELRQEGDEKQVSIVELRDQGRAGNARLLEEQKRLTDLDTVSGKQENKLERVSPDAFKAWKWLQQNQNRFKHRVFGPPIVECSLKDVRMAEAVEGLLQDSDLTCLTAQCKEDFKILQEALVTGEKLNELSIRTCRFDSLEPFPPPVSPENLQEYGLEGWAIDQLEGPAVVLAMLCQEKNLHMSAITTRNISQEQHDRIADSQIRTYVAGGRSYRFTRRTDYGAAASTAQVRNVRKARFWTNQPVDMGRKAALERDIRERKGDLIELQTQINKLKQEVEAIVAEREAKKTEGSELQTEKDRKQKALTEWNGIDTKIAQNEEKLKNLTENLKEIRARIADIQSKRDKAMLDKANTILEYVEAVHQLKEYNARFLKHEVLLVEAQNDHDVLVSRNRHIRDSLERKRQEQKTANEEYQSELQVARRVVIHVRAVKKEADDLQATEGENGLIELLTSLSENENLSEQDLENMLDVERARLELTAGGDINAIREFEERAKKIEKLQKKLEGFNQAQDEFVHSIKEVRRSFEHDLQPIIEKIDRAFGDSFKRIGCLGQVAVFKASSSDPTECTEEMGGVENGLDFANWAIHVSVTFREGERLQLLDSQRQSGGERAVSTIFYLMALQSLSRAPFRVVDEINQGMDPRNERMVHGRMVDIAAAHGNGEGQGSQYFLITPKLLSGLKYRRGMTVLCIVSGENMPNAADIKRRDENGKVYLEPGKRVDFRALAHLARSLNMGQSVGSHVRVGA